MEWSRHRGKRHQQEDRSKRAFEHRVLRKTVGICGVCPGSNQTTRLVVTRCRTGSRLERREQMRFRRQLSLTHSTPAATRQWPTRHRKQGRSDLIPLVSEYACSAPLPKWVMQNPIRGFHKLQRPPMLEWYLNHGVSAAMKKVSFDASRRTSRWLAINALGLFSSIGTCGFCIRQAFRATLAGCIGLVLIKGLGANGFVVDLAAIMTIDFTILWLLHVVAFGIRSAGQASQECSQDPRAAFKANRRLFRESLSRASLGIMTFTVTTSVLVKPASAACAGIPCGSDCCISMSQRCCVSKSGQFYCSSNNYSCN